MRFRLGASITEHHNELLPESYFPIVASVPKHFTGKNKRSPDINVMMFEDETQNNVSREEYGLPIPNAEASYKSLAKYAKPCKAYDDKQVRAWNLAAEWMERQFGPYMQNSRVKGVSEVVDSLDKTTSPGNPWTKKYVTKQAMIDDLGREKFEEMMALDWDLLAQDQEYTAIFGNSLKEEIRPKDKIAQNSIRTFTAGPVEMTIHGNRLFEDMNEKFYKGHLRHAGVVGFTPLKGGWNRLIQKLKRHPLGFALDEGQYDSSIRAHLMWACANFRWNMLRKEDQTPENLRRLLNYYRNLVNTVILTADGVLVMKQCGNPSGSVNTITDNTLILYMLLAFGWINLAPLGEASYSCFHENVELALCGDDNTWSVSEYAVKFYNARSIIPIWSAIGVTTTTDCLDPRPIDELDFLSQRTVYYEGYAVPIPEREKLLTSLYYSAYPDNPTMTLIRTAAYMQVAWADKVLLRYLRELCSWLVERYDPIMHEDPEWTLALRQIPSESQLRRLYLGENDQIYATMSHQSRNERKIIKLDKNYRQTMVNRRPVRNSRRAQRTTRVNVASTRRRLQRRNRPLRARIAVQAARPRRRMRMRGGFSGGTGVPPGNSQSGMKSCTVRHEEYIGEVNGSVSFATTKYAVNPGLAATFPWLSQQAAQWEKYRFNRLEFIFKTQVSEYATNGQKGKMIMNADYDAADPAPTTKQQAETSAPSVDALPCKNLSLALSPRQMLSSQGFHYVRSAAQPANTDIRLYDCANVHLSTQGNSDTTVIGELHVAYDVTFFVPILEATLSAAPNSFSQFNLSADDTYISTETVPFDETVVNGLGIVNTSGSFEMPVGNFLVDVDYAFVPAGAYQTTLNLYKNGAALTIPVTSIAEGTSARYTSMHMHSYVSCEAGDLITIKQSSTSATAKQDQCRITFLAL